jgi:MscS family membrane protein
VASHVCRRGRHTRPAACLIAALLCTSAAALLAQEPAKPPPPAPAAQNDPLGRQSPRGTLRGFSAASRNDDFATAGQYLQLGGRTDAQIENIVRDLNELIDRYFVRALTFVSDSPTGNLADGLPPNRERFTLDIGERAVDLFLTRVPDPDAGQIWVVSSDSLAQVSLLHRTATATVVERLMPDAWINKSLLGISLAQWVLWTISILLPLVVFHALGRLLASILRRSFSDLTRRALVLSWWDRVRWPLVCGLALGAHLAAMPFLGFSLTVRYVYARYALTIGVIVFAMLVWRVMSVSFHHARMLAQRRGRSDTRSLLMLGERVLKVLVVLSAMLLLLTLAGVDTSTALAGVGIIGVAIALGAQKSIENLLGGIFLLTDKALAVGDFCKIADRSGVIEDITLRSIRVRTTEQTLLSIPAGVLAQAGVENFATRNKILIDTILRLRYGTSSDQVHAVLDGVRQRLAEHPDIEQETSRFRLMAYGPEAIELQLFAYVLTADFGKFLTERERLLLDAAAVVEAAGSEFAGPTQFVHVGAEPRELQPR